MQYRQVIPARFVERPNRFVARVVARGREEIVHVKNTGRCRELLVPGAEVFLARAENPSRKTRHDLVAVRKAGGALFNIDSQAPNAAVGEWLRRQGAGRVAPERALGASRIDFYVEPAGASGDAAGVWLEVKGCTLERDGTGYFPDAPTARGTRHLRELARAARAGLRAAVAFVMQAECIATVKANAATDPAFAAALDEAAAAGVRVLCLPCRVEPDRLEIAGGPRLGELFNEGGHP